MKALRLDTGMRLAPFGEPVGDIYVNTRTLKETQLEALRKAGLTAVDAAPAGEPYLVYTDRCWFTAEAIRRLVATGRTGRMTLEHPGYLRLVAPLQADPGRPELAICAAGEQPHLEGPPLLLDLGLKEAPALELHPALAHTAQALYTSAALVHGVEHWSHLPRINLLTLTSNFEEYKLDFERRPWWSKVAGVAAVLWRAGGWSQPRVERAISQVGKGCRIHPTAVVESSVLGDQVEIGPFACVQAAVLGDGVRIDPYVQVRLSTLGAKARLGTGTILKFCLVMPEAHVSQGGGYQMCVFGRQSFVAVGSNFLDLSFGRTVRVEHQGDLVDAGTHFLGTCFGHRARVGNGVRVNYGMAIPNDAFLIADSADLLRRWPAGLQGPVQVREGVAVAVKGRD